MSLHLIRYRVTPVQQTADVDSGLNFSATKTVSFTRFKKLIYLIRYRETYMQHNKKTRNFVMFFRQVLHATIFFQMITL